MPLARKRPLAVVTLALAACIASDTEQQADSVAAHPDSQQVSLDTLAPVPAESAVAEPDRALADPPVDDPIPVIASSSELAALAHALIVPVQGLRGADLHDTFEESRGTGRPHDAIDIHAPRGTPVLSATSGRLLKLHNSVPGGLMVYAADASDRFILLYGHLDAYADGLSEGMALRQGQLLGYVGTTGNAPPDTPHLHFAILRGRPDVSWSRGTAVNPYPLLTGGAR